MSSIELGKKKGHDLLFDTIEQEVREVETFVFQASDTIEEISKSIKKLEDYKEVVKFISEMMHNLDGAQPSKGVRDPENALGLVNQDAVESSLQFIAGTVKHEEMERMKRMLFRFTRGRALTHCKSYEQDGVTKVAYLVVFSA